MRYLPFLFLFFSLLSCSDDDDLIIIDMVRDNLENYIQSKGNLELDEVIACAGGKAGGLFAEDNEPTSVIYYPIEGATEIRYFETDTVLDSVDFKQYNAVALDSKPLFNGYLAKFNNPIETERQGIVTFITDGKLHISNPITIKTTTLPTEVNPELLDITDNNTNPRFDWEVGIIDENAIYFQVVSDMDGNLISGTYTFEQNFTFYNLDNVVLNITDPTTNPSLEPGTEYKFTLMGVSLDNWVNLLIEQDFTTPQ